MNYISFCTVSAFYIFNFKRYNRQFCLFKRFKIHHMSPITENALTMLNTKFITIRTHFNDSILLNQILKHFYSSYTTDLMDSIFKKSIDSFASLIELNALLETRHQINQNRWSI